MALTYPRDFPDLPLNVPRCVFDFQPLGSLSRTAGGAVTFQETIGGSLWRLGLTTKPLKRTDYERWHAWFLSLRGGARGFKAYDPHRCYPLAYGPNLPATRHGGAAFDGTCNVTAVAGETITLGNLPSAYIVSEGDYISFPWLGGRALVKALETVTAALGVLTVTVGPWQRTGGTVPATAALVRAWCEMRPIPGSWSGEREAGPAPVSFEAIQTLPE